MAGLAGLQTIGEHVAKPRGSAAYMIGLGVFMHCRRPSVRIGESAFGLTRDELFTALQAEGIASRKYFHPPLHRHDAYREHRDADLPVTDRVSSQVLCLPIYSEMTDDMLDRLCLAVERIHAHAPNVRQWLGE
jgi:dTDP-4-amino-4,6-dideoxygalactose transaminase